MTKQDKTRPNIVFVLTDDQGYWALGCNGNKEIQTPVIDNLAKEGARFENFFCVSPVCSPARASLLTGRIPSQHGIHDWIRDGNMGEGAIEYLQGMRGYTEDLVDMGYTCALSGKWHLGDSIRPQKGFTRWYAHQVGGSDYYNAPVIKDGVPMEEEGYLSYAITDHAVEFIKEMADEENPFYISVNYTAPHCPWVDNHPKELTDLYSDCTFEDCPYDSPLHPWAVFSTASNAVRSNIVDDPIPHVQGYYAAVTGVDRGMGEIIEALKEKGVYDNTIIIFSSDNGYNCGHHGIWGKGNGTFPFNMYDTSVKVPLVIWHPDRIKPQVVTELISAYDFMPTLLEYLGVENPHREELPGKSVAPLLLGEEQAKDDGSMVVVFDEYGPVRMIRTKEDKYICRYPYGEDEYFDLINDSKENNNLINEPQHEERIIFLRKTMEEWFLKYTDITLDGRLERVNGNGQLDRAGMYKKTFNNYEKCHYEYKVIV